MRGLNTMRNTTLVLAAIALLAAAPVSARIDGVSGTTFDFFADDTDHITAGDGVSLLFWGYGLVGGQPQYPGPTLIVNQGDRITINLTNNLGVSTSMIFPGQAGVTSAGGDSDGLLAREADPGSSVSYSFIAAEPGTYIYQSGTRTELQTEMGLVGVIIVRPAIEGEILGKPGSRSAATTQLTRASSRKVTFLTGLCLLNTSTGHAQTLCETFHVHFRSLDSGQIERYLDSEKPYDCAGSFRSEANGRGLCR